MTIKTVGIAGTGLIGAGWAARLLVRGYDVIAYDVAPTAEAKLRSAIEVAWPSMIRLLNTPKVKRGKLSFTTDLKEMASKADFIHEAAPEREELKIRLFREISSHARPDVIIASSSSGFLPTRLQSDCTHPERVIIGHPFNPVYLLPLVETVPGAKTSPEAMDRAGKYFEAIGMHVLRLKKEIDGYICDRLQEALWREALHMVAAGEASVEQIDAAITTGPGLRWPIMGPCMTFHLAGGPGGMAHMLDHFGPALEEPWTRLQAPPLTRELRDRMVEGCARAAAGRSIAELIRERDAKLVAILKALGAAHGS
jgi:carnitine 3-dehydrogenase